MIRSLWNFKLWSYLGELKVLQYFGDLKHNSATLDAFSKELHYGKEKLHSEIELIIY